MKKSVEVPEKNLHLKSPKNPPVSEPDKGSIKPFLKSGETGSEQSKPDERHAHNPLDDEHTQPIPPLQDIGRNRLSEAPW